MYLIPAFTRGSLTHICKYSQTRLTPELVSHDAALWQGPAVDKEVAHSEGAHVAGAAVRVRQEVGQRDVSGERNGDVSYEAMKCVDA